MDGLGDAAAAADGLAAVNVCVVAGGDDDGSRAVAPAAPFGTGRNEFGSLQLCVKREIPFLKEKKETMGLY